MFRRCAVNALVDLDPDTPGHNFLPAGELPSRLTATSDSCRVISANVGSCDFSVVDVPNVAAYAVGLVPDVAPSSLVSTVVPRRSDGTPLAARPGDILAVPRRLSQALDPRVLAPRDDGTGAGTDTSTDSDTDTEDVPPFEDSCSPEQAGSVYVTFPSCQLVAEVDLLSHRILQSRQIVSDDQGNLQIVNSGPDPECPVDCPAQLEGNLPDPLPTDPDGLFPTTLALVTNMAADAPTDDPIESGSPEEEVDYDALYIGGPGSDMVFEMQIENREWLEPEHTLSLELEEAGGIHGIHVTPPMTLELGGLERHDQFLYVVAGDGSTRVVRRDFDALSLGIECDTQVDPPSAPMSACHPVDPAAAGDPPDRRAFAQGPGIRPPGGGAITDWTFQKVTAEDLTQGNDEEAGTDPDADPTTPFAAPGVVGIGVTSQGRVVYSTFGQYARATPVGGFDPALTMDITIRPHMLWPAINPFTGDAPESLPRVRDEEPERELPKDAESSVVLAPNLRRIDLAYAAPTGEETSATLEMISQSFGGIENADNLGSFEDAETSDSLYSKPVVRAVARDYREWRSQAWELQWEGQIPGTPSSTGHPGCVTEDVESGDPTCDSEQMGDAWLVDQNASFCQDGVLAGDKLVLIGCDEDEDCGLGRVCLQESAGASSASGICVAESADLDELRDTCRPFIFDDCGETRREYTIVRAFQDELWLQAMDTPRVSIVRTEQGTEACPGDAEGSAEACPPVEYQGRFVCVPRTEQPDGGCSDDEDCRAELGDGTFCIDEVCRRPCMRLSELNAWGGECDPACEAGQGCFAGQCVEECDPLLTPLPGPACFRELVRYEVRARDSFVLRGSGRTNFITDRVHAVPTVVERPDGRGGFETVELLECLEDPSVSSLLTSRIRLGADEEATLHHPVWGVEDCQEGDILPADPNPCRIATARAADQASTYHYFEYLGTEVTALRFSNPVLSLVLDLTSLRDLGTTMPYVTDQAWPVGFASFLRARIPEGYTISFETMVGYTPYDEPVAVGAVPLVYPVRVVNAPERGFVYAVDAGGRGGTRGVRGQIVRIGLGGQVLADENFKVR
jgi:hypothetical protein